MAKLRLVPILLLMLPAAEAAGAQWEFGWRTWQDSELTRPEQAGAEAIQRHEYAFSYAWQTENTGQSLTYVHEPVLIRDGEPAHNGYFHRLDYALGWDIGKVDLKAVAGIHASSNMFINTDFHADAIVLTGQARYSWDPCRCELGINGDYRFGHFQVYPTIGRQWQPTSDTRLSINLPYELVFEDEDQTWRVGIERYGNKWGALDGDREVESAYYLEEWRAKGQYRIADNLYGSRIFLELGFSFDTSVRYLDLVSGGRREEMEEAVFFGVVLKR